MKAYLCTASEPYPESRAKKEAQGRSFLVTHPDATFSEKLHHGQGNHTMTQRWNYACPHCGDTWGTRGKPKEHEDG